MAQSSRPRVFLDVSNGTEPAGRLIIELFTDKTPKTCENFRTLCTGTTPPLTYKSSVFHRVIDEFMIQGGDTTAGDGTGGMSIYGGEFEDENLGWREIDKEGLVCMANRGKGTNSSQFFITLAPTPHLNNKHTVFGHLVSPLILLQDLAKTPVDDEDCPLIPLIISHCGELERRQKVLSAPVATSKPYPVHDHKRHISTNKPERHSHNHDRGRDHSRHRHPKSLSRSPSPSSNEDSTAEDSNRHRFASNSHSPPRHSNNNTITAINTSKSHDQTRRRSDHAIDETLRGRETRRPNHSPKPHSLGDTDNADTEAEAEKTARDERAVEAHKRGVSPSRGGDVEVDRHRSRSPERRMRRRRSRQRRGEEVRGWQREREDDGREGKDIGTKNGLTGRGREVAKDGTTTTHISTRTIEPATAEPPTTTTAIASPNRRSSSKAAEA